MAVHALPVKAASAPVKPIAAPQLPSFTGVPSAVPGLPAIALPVRAAVPVAAASPKERQPQALPQLQLAAQANEDKPGSGELANHIFNGGPATRGKGPDDPRPVEPVKEDLTRLLDFTLSDRRHSWSGKGYADQLRNRLGAVQSLGGIPRKVRTGWFSSKTVVDPIDDAVLREIPAMRETLRLIAERRWNGELWMSHTDQVLRDLNDFFYSFNTLAQRAPSRDELKAELAWLYGTYRLGQPR
jgi:hypothetical protein